MVLPSLKPSSENLEFTKPWRISRLNLVFRFRHSDFLQARRRARVNPAGSFWTPQGRYYCPELAGSDVSLSSLCPRPDCEDSSIVYVLLKGEWHIAKSAEAIQQRGPSDSSIAAVAATTLPDKSARQKRRDMLHAGFVARAQNEATGSDRRCAPMEATEGHEGRPSEEGQPAPTSPQPIGDMFPWAKSPQPEDA